MLKLGRFPVGTRHFPFVRYRTDRLTGRFYAVSMKKILTLLAGVAFGAAVLFFIFDPAPDTAAPIVIKTPATTGD